MAASVPGADCSNASIAIRRHRLRRSFEIDAISKTVRSAMSGRSSKQDSDST
jgi:methyl coenzyme M reductase subunit C-like uncharacterized protein (methanogenesis marker protein 7)